MRLRTLDQDLNSHQLSIGWGGNGDVYVTIFQNDGPYEARDKYSGLPISVRVGMGGSGARIPSNIKNLFAQLATEFEKYKDLTFEADAEALERNKRFEELRNEL